MNINGKKAIVFGGTSGIGLSATQMLSEKGAHVIAVSRNPEKLKTLPKNLDATDGLAAAVCHFYNSNVVVTGKNYSGWASFAKANEGKVNKSK